MKSYLDSTIFIRTRSTITEVSNFDEVDIFVLFFNLKIIECTYGIFLIMYQYIQQLKKYIFLQKKIVHIFETIYGLPSVKNLFLKSLSIVLRR